MVKLIAFKLNGEHVNVSTDDERLLLWYLRGDLHKTGTKYGCGQGSCGACTVLLNKQPVRSCEVKLRDLAGGDVLTIEGLSKDGKLHPIQRAFIEQDAFQCGFCTPGMILQILSLIERSPTPSEQEIKESLNGHLCRCGSYQRIVQAVQMAAKEMAHV